MGCGCGLWLHCSLGGIIYESSVGGYGVRLGFDSCWASAGLGGFDGCGVWFSAFGRSGARWCVRWRPLASRLCGVFWAGLGVAVAGWVSGLGGGAACWGVRRVVLCGAQGSWGAVGAASVGAATLVGWRGSVCVRVWAWGDIPRASAFSSRLLEGLPQAPEDIRVVLGRGGVAKVDSQGVERIRQHGFPCGLWHPPPRRLEAAVFRGPLAGPVHQALEEGLCPGPFWQLSELRVGPAPPSLSLGRALALGRGVGVVGCDGVVRNGGGGGPGKFLIVLCRGCAWKARGAGGCGLAGTRARTRRGGGSGAFAVCGLTLRGQRRCWLTLALLWSGWGWSVGLGCGLAEVAGQSASRFSRGALCHEGGCGASPDDGGAPCSALLPPALGWVGPNVVQDVLGGSGSRCRCCAGLGLGLRSGCRLQLRRVDRFRWVLGGGLGSQPSCGRGPR